MVMLSVNTCTQIKSYDHKIEQTWIKMKKIISGNKDRIGESYQLSAVERSQISKKKSTPPLFFFFEKTDNRFCHRNRSCIITDGDVALRPCGLRAHTDTCF